MTQPLHVLLVDDHPSDLDSLDLRLQRNGYRTSLARDAERALATASTDPPDVALLNISAPERKGYETCKALKRLLPQLPVIIYAKAANDTDRDEAAACGADDIIVEPADRALVIQRIVQLLAR